MHRANVMVSTPTFSAPRVDASRSASSIDSNKCFMPRSLAKRVASKSIFLLKLGAFTISCTVATAVRKMIAKHKIKRRIKIPSSSRPV